MKKETKENVKGLGRDFGVNMSSEIIAAYGVHKYLNHREKKKAAEKAAEEAGEVIKKTKLIDKLKDGKTLKKAGKYALPTAGIATAAYLLNKYKKKKEKKNEEEISSFKEFLLEKNKTISFTEFLENH